MQYFPHRLHLIGNYANFVTHFDFATKIRQIIHNMTQIAENPGNTQRTPAVSILVPCYNVEKYLPQCLDSIINQTLEDIEIICLNDGSKDRTLDIIRDYAERDGRIVVVDKPNSGYGATMNKGLDVARGKYIGIVESDDFIEPDMFKRLYETAEEYNLDLARCLNTEYNELTGKKEYSNFESIGLYKCNEVFKPREQKYIFYIQPSIWDGLYRKNLLDDNGIRFLETPGASFQDTSFAFKVYSVAQRVMVIREFLHNYRINEGSSVSSTGKVFCVCEEEAEIRRFAREQGIYDDLKGVMAVRAFGCYKWNYNRLTSKYKREFILHFSKEVRQWIADGVVNRKWFSLGRLIRLNLIAYCPRIFYFTKKI